MPAPFKESIIFCSMKQGHPNTGGLARWGTGARAPVDAVDTKGRRNPEGAKMSITEL